MLVIKTKPGEKEANAEMGQANDATHMQAAQGSDVKAQDNDTKALRVSETHFSGVNWQRSVDTWLVGIEKSTKKIFPALCNQARAAAGFNTSLPLTGNQRDEALRADPAAAARALAESEEDDNEVNDDDDSNNRNDGGPCEYGNGSDFKDAREVDERDSNRLTRAEKSDSEESFKGSEDEINENLNDYNSLEADGDADSLNHDDERDSMAGVDENHDDEQDADDDAENFSSVSENALVSEVSLAD